MNPTRSSFGVWVLHIAEQGFSFPIEDAAPVEPCTTPKDDGLVEGVQGLVNADLFIAFMMVLNTSLDLVLALLLAFENDDEECFRVGSQVSYCYQVLLVLVIIVAIDVTASVIERLIYGWLERVDHQ